MRKLQWRQDKQRDEAPIAWMIERIAVHLRKRLEQEIVVAPMMTHRPTRCLNNVSRDPFACSHLLLQSVQYSWKIHEEYLPL